MKYQESHYSNVTWTSLRLTTHSPLVQGLNQAGNKKQGPELLVLRAESSCDIGHRWIPHTKAGNTGIVSMWLPCPLFSRLVIYSSYEVQTPYDDWACQDNCYEPCGAISQVDQFTNVGDTLTLRFFHVRLSDIVMYTGNTAKKVREAKAFFQMMSYTGRII